MHSPLRSRLDPAHFLLPLHLHLISLLDVLLSGSDTIHLGGNEARLEPIALSLFLEFLIYLFEKPLPVVHLQLILEFVAKLVSFLHLN